MIGPPGWRSSKVQLARIDFGGKKSYFEAPRISLKLGKNTQRETHDIAATLAKHLFGGRFT
eukprot:scaffold863_cov82-Skeletonema_dohrnii-CCMP3373.AAC.2